MASTSAGFIGIINDRPTDIISAHAYGAGSAGWWFVAGSHSNQSTLSLSGGQRVFNDNMIQATPGGSGTSKPIGLAMHTVSSGTSSVVALARKGDFIVPCNGDVTVATNQACTYASAGEGCIANAATGSVAGADIIGQAYNTNASGANYFAILHLNL